MERVGSAQDRLRPQGLHRPVGVDLSGHRPLNVPLERYLVHDRSRPLPDPHAHETPCRSVEPPQQDENGE